MITPALDRVLLAAPQFKDVSEPTTSDTMQEAKYLWADEDGTFITGAEAQGEMGAMAPLDRVRIMAYLADAKEMLKAGNWREAQGPLVSAEQIAAGVDARHVVRELLAHLRALRAYMNRTNDPKDEGSVGGKPWPRGIAKLAAEGYHPYGNPNATGAPHHATSPEVSAATVEQHLATAHGRGHGFARAMSDNPLMAGHAMNTGEMLRMHERAHMTAQNHTHGPTRTGAITRARNPAQEFQHAMVASALTKPEEQTAGTHHMVQGHPRTGGLERAQEAARQRFEARRKVMPGRRY